MHNDLRRKYLLLEARLMDLDSLSQEDSSRFNQELKSIECEEPPILCALMDICHREVNRISGIPDKSVDPPVQETDQEFLQLELRARPIAASGAQSDGLAGIGSRSLKARRAQRYLYSFPADWFLADKKKPGHKGPASVSATGISPGSRRSRLRRVRGHALSGSATQSISAILELERRARLSPPVLGIARSRLPSWCNDHACADPFLDQAKISCSPKPRNWPLSFVATTVIVHLLRGRQKNNPVYSQPPSTASCSLSPAASNQYR